MLLLIYNMIINNISSVTLNEFLGGLSIRLNITARDNVSVSIAIILSNKLHSCLQNPKNFLNLEVSPEIQINMLLVNRSDRYQMQTKCQLVKSRITTVFFSPSKLTVEPQMSPYLSHFPVLPGLLKISPKSNGKI